MGSSTQGGARGFPPPRNDEGQEPRGILWGTRGGHGVAKSQSIGYMYQLGPCWTGQGKSLKEVLDALQAYTETHYRRMEELDDESYLVEYCIR